MTPDTDSQKRTTHESAERPPPAVRGLVTGDATYLDRCPFCNYDLRGSSRDGKCPECGFAYFADDLCVRPKPTRTVRLIIYSIFASLSLVLGLRDLVSTFHPFTLFGASALLMLLALFAYFHYRSEWRRKQDFLILRSDGFLLDNPIKRRSRFVSWADVLEIKASSTGATVHIRGNKRALVVSTEIFPRRISSRDLADFLHAECVHRLGARARPSNVHREGNATVTSADIS